MKGSVVVTAAALLILMANKAPTLHAFQPHSFVRITNYHHHHHGTSLALWEGSDSNDKSSKTSDTDNNDVTETKGAVGRAGGRRRRLFGTSQPKRGRGWNGLVPAVVLFSLLLIFVPIFGGGGSDSSPQSVYYYQSSSFESRVYNSDGSVQTTRKESVQTNMPSLLEGSRLLEDRRVITEGYARPSIEHDDF